MAELTDAEKEIFDIEFDRLFTTHFKCRTALEIANNHRDYILDSAELAKEKFDDAPFGGVNARSTEFGWTLVRPQMIRTTSKASPVRTWERTVSTTAWNDWLGTSTAAVRINENALLVVIGYVCYSGAPKASAVLEKVLGADLPVFYLEPGFKIGNIFMIDRVNPWRIEPTNEFYIQTLDLRLGNDELSPFGIYFAKGSHLREKDPYPDSAT